MFGPAAAVCCAPVNAPIPDVTEPAPTPVWPACVIPARSKGLRGATWIPGRLTGFLAKFAASSYKASFLASTPGASLAILVCVPVEPEPPPPPPLNILISLTPFQIQYV